MPNEETARETPGFSLLKQRFPLLMLDKVLSWEKDRELKAVKNISVNDTHFQGHFPGHPIFPGVLVIECFAQAASLLVRLTEESSLENVFDAIGMVLDFHFLKPIFPGDRLEVHITLSKTAGPNRMFSGKGYVDGQEVASGKFSLGKLRLP